MAVVVKQEASIPVVLNKFSVTGLVLGANLVAHGLGQAPAFVLVQPKGAGNGIPTVNYNPAATDATNVALVSSGAGDCDLYVG